MSGSAHGKCGAWSGKQRPADSDAETSAARIVGAHRRNERGDISETCGDITTLVVVIAGHRWRGVEGSESTRGAGADLNVLLRVFITKVSPAARTR